MNKETEISILEQYEVRKREIIKIFLDSLENENIYKNLEYDYKNENFVEQDKVSITNEMKSAIKAILNEDIQIVWIYGSAGTGKTTFLEFLHSQIGFLDSQIKKLRAEFYEEYHISGFLDTDFWNDHVVRLAPTGAAALLINGSTIHNFFSLPVIKNSGVYVPQTVDYYNSLSNLDLDLWYSTNYIIIDEISMVRADVLDEINRRMQAGKENEEPFGGAKLILLGDPYQLSPVLLDKDIQAFRNLGYTTPYFFSSFVFKNLLQKNRIKHIEFKNIFRQRDEKFLEILNNFRLGNVSKEDLNFINNRFHEKVPDDVLYLTSTRKNAENINTKKYNEINSDEVTFTATATGTYGSSLTKALTSPETYIKDFPAPSVLKLKIGTHILLLTNENSFVNGTIAVITSIEQDQITATDNKETYFIKRHIWEEKEYIHDSNGLKLQTIGTYTQFPITYGWALTIHKAQGKTVERISVSLENGAFTAGQTYVALSRVKSIEGLFLEARIRMSDIKQNNTVKKYFDYCEKKGFLDFSTSDE